MVSSSTALIVLGLLTVFLALFIPAAVIEEKGVCMDGREYCHDSEKIYYEDPMLKDIQPELIIGGLVLTIVGAAIAVA